MSKPNLFPKLILDNASATPPIFITIADTIFLSFIFFNTKSKFSFNSSLSNKKSFWLILFSTKYILFLAFLNSVDITSFTFTGLTANEINVGGTEISLNVPLIESLPPIAATSKFFCTFIAPSNARNGFDHLYESLPSFSKYSWNESLAVL